jgi:hypothetical protein
VGVVQANAESAIGSAGTNRHRTKNVLAVFGAALTFYQTKPTKFDNAIDGLAYEAEEAVVLDAAPRASIRTKPLWSDQACREIAVWSGETAMKSRGFTKIEDQNEGVLAAEEVQETRRLMRLFCATGFARLCGHAVGSLEIQHAIVLGL